MFLARRYQPGSSSTGMVELTDGFNTDQQFRIVVRVHNESSGGAANARIGPCDDVWNGGGFRLDAFPHYPDSSRAEAFPTVEMVLTDEKVYAAIGNGTLSVLIHSV